VSGAVRDACLGLASKDCNIEVYGIAPEKLKQFLSLRYGIDLVADAFGVVKIRHYPIDISISRRESKKGLGHIGFEVLSDPYVIV
jgi:tRNA nucleotidyltransferase (CCA-adding enzyme)